MNPSTLGKLENFIWSIADQILVDVYDVGEYRKVILPMLIIRRFDAILETKHELIIAKKKELLGKNWNNIDYKIESSLERAINLPFINQSEFTLKKLSTIVDRAKLKSNFENYLDGFSENIRDIIDKFKFREQIPTLSRKDRLMPLIEKFVSTDINLSNKDILNEDGEIQIEALDNHTMGTLFENIIRMFNEQTNVTDAGRHFTPRDIIKLMADIAFIPVADKIQDTTYLIYDGACGTGGMLTVAEERLQDLANKYNKEVSIHIYGQEIADETYAIAKSDILIKGGDQDNIALGSTLSNDKFNDEIKTFDFMLSNPPFGTSWKAELKANNWIEYTKKDAIKDRRFVINYDGDEFSMLPDIGDQQMLFLANNVSKMKNTTQLGSRIVEVHNGSSLFTGAAGSGASNLRRYIIENDYLEAIIALPEKMFYNTGIGTFLWILANKKEDHRKGTVQLIDATSLKSPLRKSLGEKNCEISDEIRAKIIELYTEYENADPKFSRIFKNEEFGYYSVNIVKPYIDDKGKTKLEKIDTEQIPLTYEGGIEAFFKNEIKPYLSEAVIDEKSITIGYELSFTKYFYQPEKLRSIEEIFADIAKVEMQTFGLLQSIANGQ